MKHEELVYDFINGATKGGSGGRAYGEQNCRIEGNKLYSYSTVIAFRDEETGLIILNVNKYSSSTSRIQTLVKRNSYNILEVDFSGKALNYVDSLEELATKYPTFAEENQDKHEVIKKAWKKIRLNTILN